MPLTPEEELELGLGMAKARSRYQDTQPGLDTLQNEVISRNPFDVSQEDQMREKFDTMFSTDGSSIAGEAAVARMERDATQREHNQAVMEHMQSPGSLLDIPKGVGKGLVNAGREVNRLGVSAKDLLTGSDDTRHFDAAFPKMETNPLSMEEGLAENVSRIGVGTVLGGKGAGRLVNAGTPAKSNIGNIGKGAAVFTGQAAGATATEDPNVETFFMNNLQIDPNDPDAKNMLKHKLELMEEAFLLGGLAGGVTKGVTTAGKLVRWPYRAAKNWNNLDSNKKQFAMDLMHVFAGITPDTPRAEVKARLAEGVALVGKNKNIAISLGDASVDDISQSQDTISAMIDSLDMNNPQHRVIRTQLEGIRSSAVHGNAPELITKMDEPEAAFRQTVDAFHNTRGGEQGIQQGKDRIVELGQQEVAPAREAVRQAEADVVTANRGLDAEMQDNPAFKQISEKADPSGVKIDMSGKAIDTATDITQNINIADDLLTKEKNALWANIPEGVQINPEGLANQIEQAAPHLDKDLTIALNDASNDFRKLNDFASTKLQTKIDSLFTKDIRHQDPDLLNQANALKNLRDYITGDMVDDVIDSPDAAEAMANLTKAREFYNTTYRPKFRDAPLKDVQRNTRFMPEKEAMVTNRGVIGDALSDPNKREYADNILDTLAMDEGGRSAGLAVDYALYNVAKKVQDAFNKSGGKLTPEDIAGLTGEFDKYIPVFKKVAPEKIGELEEFLTNVRNKNFNVDDAKKILDLRKDAAEKAEEEVFGRKLAPFFTKDKRGFTSKENGFESFRSVIDSPEGASKLREILSSGDEVAIKGAQAAWAKEAKYQLFENQKGVGALTDNLEKAGRQLYNDTTIDAIIKLRGLTEKSQRAKVARQAGALDVQGPQTMMSSAVNHVTTWVFGILNPTAARLRTVSREFLKDRDATGVARQAADAILANSDEFHQIVTEMVQKGQDRMDPTQKRNLFRALVQSGISGLRSEDEETFVKDETDVETEDAFNINPKIPSSESVPLEEGESFDPNNPEPERSGQIFPVKPTGELKPYDPSLRERIGNKVFEGAEKIGFSRDQSKYLRDKTQQGVDFIPGPGEAVGADEAIRSFKRGDYGQAALEAGSTALGAIPGGGDLAAAATKAMFGGIMAKTADKAALREAKRMTDEGFGREKILRDTGWFKDKDGEWKFEIDDSKARMRSSQETEERLNKKKFLGGATINDYIDHPDLKDAYPGLMEMEVTVDDPENLGLSKTMLGAYAGPPDDRMFLNYMQKENPLKVILHELQHGIQHREGFAKGSMVANNISQLQSVDEVEAYKEIVTKLMTIPSKRDFNNAVIEATGRAPLATDYDEYIKAIEDLILNNPEEFKKRVNNEAFRVIYSRSAGENEADNVMKRMNLNAFERRNIFFPWETENVPQGEQIVNKAKSLPGFTNYSVRKKDTFTDDDIMEMGKLQRDKPERAMLTVQHVNKGGVLSPVVEHSGDLQHRTSELKLSDGSIQDMYKEKVKRVKRYLNDPYGFEREMKENMKNNKTNKTELDAALQAFADEHRKLPAYTELHKTIREANIAIGEQKWDKARELYETLDKWANLPTKEFGKLLGRKEQNHLKLREK